MKSKYKNIIIYNIGYVAVKDLSYAIINSVYSLYLIIDKIYSYMEEGSRNGKVIEGSGAVV